MRWQSRGSSMINEMTRHDIATLSICQGEVSMVILMKITVIVMISISQITYTFITCHLYKKISNKKVLLSSSHCKFYCSFCWKSKRSILFLFHSSSKASRLNWYCVHAVHYAKIVTEILLAFCEFFLFAFFIVSLILLTNYLLLLSSLIFLRACTSFLHERQGW